MNPENRIHRKEMLRRAVLAGNEDAWRVWYLEVFDELDRFAFWRYGGRRNEADEIVQETWLTAVRQIRSFRPENGSFLAWLRGIAANVRRNQLRGVRRLSQRETNAGGQVYDAAETESVTNDLERNEQIAAALDGLLERQESVGGAPRAKEEKLGIETAIPARQAPQGPILRDYDVLLTKKSAHQHGYMPALEIGKEAAGVKSR